jgi:hypothetical protein
VSIRCVEYSCILFTAARYAKIYSRVDRAMRESNVSEAWMNAINLAAKLSTFAEHFRIGQRSSGSPSLFVSFQRTIENLCCSSGRRQV